LFRTILVLLLLLILVWGLLHTAPVQNWAAKKITNFLSKEWKTEVEVKGISFSLFNKLQLHELLIRDQQQDTLLFAGELKTNITDWFFLQSQVELKYIGLKDASIRLYRSDSIWNYRFLEQYFSGGSTPKKTKSRPLNLRVKEIDLENIELKQIDGWRGEDITVQLQKLEMSPELISFRQKLVRLHQLTLIDPAILVYQYKGNRPPRPKKPQETDPSYPTQNDTLRSDELEWNPEDWQVSISEVKLVNGSVKHDRQTNREAYASFDPMHILFKKINGTLQKFSWQKDTIAAKTTLSFQEKSGLKIDTLQAMVKFHPRSLRFERLRIKTPESLLEDYFELKYNRFQEDMNDFERKVNLVGRFQQSIISSNDIAYFAPEVKNWDKKIKLTGDVRGTIENLRGNNLIIEAGKNTYLKGDLTMTGLPYINETFINLTAKEARTNYAEAAVIVPQLTKIKTPAIQKIDWLQFTGSFTGFLRDFVTYGTIQTNLGTIRSDLNMKIPEKGESTYSGSLQAKNLDLGQLFEIREAGNISFNANLKGKGLSFNRLAATLDAQLQSFEYNGYTYSNIEAKGGFNRRRFTGNMSALDSNLIFSLNGTIDFDPQIPEFDFEALVNKADLQALRLVKKPFDFTGQLSLNFVGDDIDNFLGEARIFNASAYLRGKRISFDSLSLRSQIIEDYKSLELKTNELDAAIIGKFSVRDMPAAIQLFLNNYYPSYVKKPQRLSTNEDFSFVVKTKEIEDYLDLLDAPVEGFNNSAFSGRINSAENIFSVEGDVPQFGYEGVTFNNISLKGNGDLQKLELNTVIGTIVLNDSLYFPETSLQIQSAKDVSEVRIQATANQTFNTANISARVTTLDDGVNILFNPSNFDINGKTWMIDKNGALSLRKNQLTNSELRLYQDQQEVLIRTEPSDIGNTNDIKIELSKINIGDFAPFITRSNQFEGLLNGSITVMDPLGKATAEGSLNMKEFRIDNDSIGTVTANANYIDANGKINFLVESYNKDYEFNLSGTANLKDSTEEEIDLLVSVQQTKIHLLEQYLRGIFSKMEGKATGQLRIKGRGNKLKYIGPVRLEEGLVEVDYTKVTYNIPNALLQFTEEGIDLGRITIRDRYGDSARVSGTIQHQNFTQMKFNIGVNANRLELLNTKITDNNLFYGTARGMANLTLTGPENDLKFYMRAQPTDSSRIVIPDSYSRESGKADFIVWKQYGRELTGDGRGKMENNYTVDLDITANNFLTIDLVLDDLTNDVIKATGSGNIQLHTGSRDRFTMNGRYEIDRGFYNFSFQTLVKKPFTLRQGAGNFIQWSGDPYNAEIKIDAEYVAENVRFSDLISAQNSALISDPNIRKYRGDVYVIAELRGQLSQPNIKFNFDFPANMPFRNDLAFNQALELIKRDELELNKQVTYLVVFGSFAPFSSNNVDVGASFVEGVVVNTLTGIFSNTLSREFNSVLQKIFKDESLKVNITTSFYNGSNIVLENTSAAGRNGLVIDRSNFNFSIGKSILNDRLTFNFGSELDFGLSTFQQAQLNFQFLPDLNAEWKITPDGRVRATFFTRNSYDFYIGRQRNRSGASISVRREFEKLSDFFNNKRSSAPKDSNQNNLPTTTERQ
jgi:hypothetical protein